MNQWTQAKTLALCQETEPEGNVDVNAANSLDYYTYFPSEKGMPVFETNLVDKLQKYRRYEDIDKNWQFCLIHDVRYTDRIRLYWSIKVNSMLLSME